MAHAPEIESNVLAANAAFYRAFNSGDGRGMVALWSEEHPVACFHPGSPVLLGRLAVSEISEVSPSEQSSSRAPGTSWVSSRRGASRRSASPTSTRMR